MGTTQRKHCTDFKTKRLSRLLSRHYDTELAKAGLKTTQFTLLSHLVLQGAMTQGELAQKMGLEPSTLTRNLKLLMDKEWVTHELGSDARIRLISITATGEAKQREADQFWRIAQKTINSILGKERVEALNSLLDQCASLLGEYRARKY